METIVVPNHDGMSVLEEGIIRARSILSGYPIKALFSSDDFMKYYNCVYFMCLNREHNNFPVQLYTRYKRALEESIVLVVLPSLMNKHDGPLLIELMQMWEHYKTMAKCLAGFFSYLDSHYVSFHKATPLKDISVDCFCDLVCNNLFDKFRDAAISMINLERGGNLIDCNILKNVLTFSVEIREKRSAYYENFEQVLLADTASYYSQLASEWLFHDSVADYMLKVDLCLNKENTRLGQYLRQTTMNKLLQVVQWQLIGQTKSKLMEKQKAESHEPATYQELLRKCSSMSLEDHSHAPPLGYYPSQNESDFGYKSVRNPPL